MFLDYYVFNRFLTDVLILHPPENTIKDNVFFMFSWQMAFEGVSNFHKFVSFGRSTKQGVNQQCLICSSEDMKL